MDDLRQGFLVYKQTVYPLQRAALERLAEDGQRPTTLVIGCSDSRVKITELVQAEAGRLFIVRNAGNIVPRWGEHIGGVTASIEFAVEMLPIQEIVVCGHSSCGAIDAMLYPEKVENMPAVKRWLSYAAKAPVRAREMSEGMNIRELAEHTSRENVRLQLEHLREFPCVIQREKRGELKLHGWFLRIQNTELWELNEATGAWELVG